ncbi:NUDIX domain-containing protein [Deinococcus taeanensis]|uniref:NUDIX domain-containing protein n=1 Tax=Deinococcus taeanensis TaxID=2737050 RepID=UPI001CDCEB64|nr:NUDIX domain-containing protein [Deinococcus taeanensis]UBV43461.1 NUDIX domain-containing protein [Deinococcus taeanensis]
MITFYDTQDHARLDAAMRGLREKALCLVTRPGQLLVFEHVPAGQAGVQVAAGGVEPGETSAQAAVRELREETGLNLTAPTHVTSYLWEAALPHRFTRQVCHAFMFHARTPLPGTWDHVAEQRHLFRFRWAPLHAPGLDWEMDAALPHLHALLKEKTPHD